MLYFTTLAAKNVLLTTKQIGVLGRNFATNLVVNEENGLKAPFSGHSGE